MMDQQRLSRPGEIIKIITSVQVPKSTIVCEKGDITFFLISSDPMSLSHITDLAPFIVAILRTISEGNAVGSVVPLAKTSRPLLIREARYISSTAIQFYQK